MALVRHRKTRLLLNFNVADMLRRMRLICMGNENRIKGYNIVCIIANPARSFSVQSGVFQSIIYLRLTNMLAFACLELLKHSHSLPLPSAN